MGRAAVFRCQPPVLAGAPPAHVLGSLTHRPEEALVTDCCFPFHVELLQVVGVGAPGGQHSSVR